MRQRVLALYRDLLRYQRELRLTDKAFYVRRVREEFRRNKDATEVDRLVKVGALACC